MAVAHRASAASASTNPTTTWTVILSASIAAGDDLFVSVTSRDHTSGTARVTCTDDDAGGNTWTLISESSDRKASLFWKKATSATASKTVTIAGAVGSSSGGYSAYSGCDLTPYTNVSVEDNASADETHAGFTPDVAASMIALVVFNTGNDNAVTSPACTDPGALTNRFEKLSTGGTDCSNNFSSELQSGGPTATGSFTWAQTNGTTKSIVLAIKRALEGVLTKTLDALTSSAAGAVEIGAAAAITLGAMTSVATGTVEVAGTASPTLGAMTSAATGTVEVAGASAVVLGAVTLSAQGTVEVAGINGVLDAQLGVLSSSAAGTVAVAGSASPNLATITSVATGTVEIGGSASPTLGPLMAAASGSVDVAGVFARTLGPLTAIAAGTVDVGGSAVSVLGPMTSSATGMVDVVGTSSAMLAPLTLLAQGMVGQIEILGAGAIVLAPLTLYAQAVRPAPIFSAAAALNASAVSVAGSSATSVLAAANPNSPIVGAREA